MDWYEMVIDAAVSRLGLEGEKQVDWGGHMEGVEVEVLEIGDGEWGPRQWEKAIRDTGIECIYGWK